MAWADWARLPLRRFDVAGGLLDLAVAFLHLVMTGVGGGRGLAAGARDLVGGCDHLVEGGGDQLHGFALATGYLVHAGRRLGGGLRGLLQIVGGLADALHQLADAGKELVEPARQGGGFVLALHVQALGQIAFALGDGFQAGGDTADRPHDHAGKGRAEHGEQQRQHRGDAGDLPGQGGGLTHDFAALDQADEFPAEVLGLINVDHVVGAVEIDLTQPALDAAEGLVGVAQLLELLEVVLGIAGVDQHVAVVFHQHQVAALAQGDALDQVGELLERDVQAHHAADLAAGVFHGPYHAHQRDVVGRPVVGRVRTTLPGLFMAAWYPGAHARIVVGQLGVVRPADVAAIGQAHRQVGGGGVGLGEAGEIAQRLLAGCRLRDLGGIGAAVVLQPLQGQDVRLLGEEVDVLLDAGKELLNVAIDLADFAPAAVEEVAGGLTAHVHDDHARHQDHREAGGYREKRGEFLFDVHRKPRSRAARRVTATCLHSASAWISPT